MFKNAFFQLLLVISGIGLLGSCANHRQAPPKASTKDSTHAVRDSATGGADSSRTSDSTHSTDSTVKSGDSSTAQNDSLATQDTTQKPAVPILLTYSEHQGQYLYGRYCAVCHGTEGKGDGFNAFNLDPKPRDFSEPKWIDGMTDQRIAQTIRDGGRILGKSPLMPAWGGSLNADEISYLVSYVRVLSIDTGNATLEATNP